MTALQTLLHPFETGLLPLPEKGMRGIVLNAQPGMRLPEGFEAELVLQQGFRPLFLSLEKSGYDVAPEPQGDGYDLALVIAGRHRRQNELWVAEALRRTRAGALVVIAGAKNDGIASLRKRITELLPVTGSTSKYHGVAFWLERAVDGAPLEAAMDVLTPAECLVEGRFHTAHGGFSADAVDAGSRLLADHLPPDLAGEVADFCAGWGYLSARLAEQPAVRSIDLYEADHASLQAARRNLSGIRPAISFHWHDLAAEPIAHRYDALVMNPPFHQGRAAEPELGLRMIRAAKAALKPGGRLFLVANRALAYEQELATSFRASSEIIRDGSYKLLAATR